MIVRRARRSGTPRPDGASTWRRSARYYARPYRARLMAVGACTIAQAALAVAPVAVIKAFIDDLQHRQTSFARIGLLLAAGTAIVAAGSLIGVLRSWLVLTVRTRVIADLRQELAERLLGQSLSYFTRTRGGELMSRMLNDVAAVESMLDALLTVASNAVTLLGVVVVMFVLEWHLALVTVLVVPILVLAVKLGNRPIYRRRLRVQQRLGALTSALQESLSLSGIMLIKSFGREEAERRRIAALNDDVREAQIGAAMLANWVGVALGILQFLAPAALLATGAWLVVHGFLSLGALTAFVTVLGLRFAASITISGNGLITVAGALAPWSRIFEVLDGTPEIVELPGAVTLSDARGALEFDAVTFSYSARTEPALRDFSLDVAPGQLVALVGPSGAGKTTLCNLVPRFYDPQQGTVRIDGHDVRRLTLASLGRLAGIVLQETYLFHGTLRDNLCYARPDASEAELTAACAEAQLAGVIAGLPDGLDTVVGERGHRLSGGEKQRVAIARVILKGAPVLILDEATSHLDSLSEHLVQEALTRLFHGRTSLVIAHRLSTVLAADLIVVLDHGRVVEQGTHAELVAAGGLYRSIYELQFRPASGERVPI